jgi:hypothetical protein
VVTGNLDIDGREKIGFEITWFALKRGYELDDVPGVQDAARCWVERTVGSRATGGEDFLPMVCLEVALGCEAFLARVRARYRQRQRGFRRERGCGGKRTFRGLPGCDRIRVT